jgi:hypothetical protein
MPFSPTGLAVVGLAVWRVLVVGRVSMVALV